MDDDLQDVEIRLWVVQESTGCVTVHVGQEFLFGFIGCIKA